MGSNSRSEGNRNLRRNLTAIGLFALAACSQTPKTDAELAGAAQSAVDKKLDTQGTFSLMEAVLSQNIACGHVVAADAPGRGNVEQDFVFQNDRLIMDDDPDFDSAAIACDLAAGGGNSADEDNVADN